MDSTKFVLTQQKYRIALSLMDYERLKSDVQKCTENGVLVSPSCARVLEDYEALLQDKE